MQQSRYRRFLLALGLPVLALSLLCVGLGFWLQPLVNDLTRLGGYAENLYGWNGEQEHFTTQLARPAVPGHEYDVVVIGDSFTQPDGPPVVAPHGNYWTDFFARDSGLRVATYHMSRMTPEHFLASDAFAQAPPALLVLQLAERNLGLFKDHAGDCPAPVPSPRFSPELRPLDQAPVRQGRETAGWINSSRLDAALDFLAKNGSRVLFGVNTTSVRRHTMTEGHLFTSRRSSELLFYDRDLAKLAFDAGDIRRIGCYLQALQAQVVRNGRTAFIVMIAPDKANAYSRYVPGLQLPNLVERLAQDTGLDLLRLDRAFEQAIAAGRQDVYLPSDTHWGSAGKAIAAASLLAHLRPVRVQAFESTARTAMAR